MNQEELCSLITLYDQLITISVCAMMALVTICATAITLLWWSRSWFVWRWWCGSAFVRWWSSQSAFARWWRWWREVGGVPEQNSLETCFYLVLSSTLHCHGHDPGHGQHHHFHHHHYQCHPPAHHHHHHHNHRQYWDFGCHPHYNHHRILAQIKDDSQKIPLFKEHKPESNITAPECLEIVQNWLRMLFFQN